MKNEIHPIYAGMIAIAVAVLVGLLLWGVGASKAAAYERVTGKKVSSWDALILDLKVHH